jgi:hypothetical protein
MYTDCFAVIFDFWSNMIEDLEDDSQTISGLLVSFLCSHDEKALFAADNSGY